MTVLAHAVLNFADADGSADGNGGSGAGHAFLINYAPQQPKVNDTVRVEIFGPDYWWLKCDAAIVSARKATSAETHTERLDMTGQQQLNTQYPVASILSAQAKTPLVDGDTQKVIISRGGIYSLHALNGYAVFNADNLYGSVEVKYRGYQKQYWDITGLNSPGVYVIFANNKGTGQVEKIVLTVTDEDESDEATLVTINARDFCTDANVSGASVYIDGAFKGNTDSNGRLSVGTLQPGSYALRIVASGYLATDADELANDSFTI